MGVRLPGAVGALLRHEGLYSSHLATWRAARDRGAWVGPAKKRGPTPQIADPRDKKIAELEREAARWHKRAERAETLVEVQKNLRRCWGPRSTPRDRDGAGDRHRATARHRPDLRGARVAPGHLLPAAAAPTCPVAATALASCAPHRRAGRRPRGAPRAALRGSPPRGGLRDPPRRGAVPLLRADDVPPPDSPSGGSGAAEPAPASPLRRPRAPRPPAERAVELGHHQAP